MDQGVVGVADYYAILGIGDSLRQHNHSCSSNNANNSADISENEAADWEERFLREIVEVEWRATATTPGDDTTVLHTTLPTRTACHIGNQIVWEEGSEWEADLVRLPRDIHQLWKTASTTSNSQPEAPPSQLSGLRRKMENKLKSLTSKRATSPLQVDAAMQQPSYFLAQQTRQQLQSHDKLDRLAIADLEFWLVRLHPVLLLETITSEDDDTSSSESSWVPLQDYLRLPEGFDSWTIPPAYRKIRDPANAWSSSSSTSHVFFGHDTVEATLIAAQNNDPTVFLPQILRTHTVGSEDDDGGSGGFVYVPVVAVRRQRCTTEERYHEDAAVVEIGISFCDHHDGVVEPAWNEDDDDDDDVGGAFRVLRKSPWVPQSAVASGSPGYPALMMRRNLPFGLANVAFSTRVQGRFPLRNYKGLPLPEEELPMFCYPTGCRLHRARLCEAPVPQCYGFCVKNERGDSIYVSCVSFMEPLTQSKSAQLDKISQERRSTSLAHRYYCEKELGQRKLMIGFDEMTTFENKTICLVSRFPFWTAFRKFLAHLQLLAGSTSDLPLERWISHLLLTVPLPRPGGPAVVVPLLHDEPMVFVFPPDKDLPLLDLPLSRLFSCLNVKTVVTIVLGLLALERKVIVISTRPSLVLDICELLRALLFPFELCAPYVPRLTEPFKSSLDFPGAIFVGIHDDSLPTGLGNMVRNNYPEDSIIVDLDTGNVDCDGDRYEVLTGAWDSIPRASRSQLVLELETLCQDAKIVDGQEPLDSLGDSAFFVDLPVAAEDFEVTNDDREPIDDRAVRDAFLRFFCSVLGGYERYLVAPDADFLVSGDEWFDAKGFLSDAPADRAKYLGSFVSTQLFQSFIQKRTETGDVHCILFDECLAEYHSTSIPYGRLGGDVEACPSDNGKEQLMYSLLVDQSARLSSIHDQPSVILPSRSTDTSDADSSVSLNLSRASASVAESSVRHAESVVDDSGNLVVGPSRLDLLPGAVFSYFVDGNPCFPYALDPQFFLPQEPTSCEVEVSKSISPSLARSERELEDAARRRRMATSLNASSIQNHRRCLWQLPKLLGSHLLGAWLLCVPTQVAQKSLSPDQQTCYLMRALGAMRVMRSKHRIVPDEATYRAMMVACGRCQSDRRVELVKLFGLLRSDGIFPNAMTLGQYTKALAEGYSKRSVAGTPGQDEDVGVEVSASGSKLGLGLLGGTMKEKNFSSVLSNMDPSLEYLESHGKRWRQKSSDRDLGEEINGRKKRSSKPWLPVVMTSSLLPNVAGREAIKPPATTLVAMWSRNRSCSHCCYVPLEEEIQAGWDSVGDVNAAPGSVECPRCGTYIVPTLGYKEFSLAEAREIDPTCTQQTTPGEPALPPQLSGVIEKSLLDDASFVTYMCPATLRETLERYIEEFGEHILERERLKSLDQEVYFNLSWYCARFALPLPLPVDNGSRNIFFFASWDRSAAERGCLSASKVLSPISRMIEESISAETPSNEDHSLVEHYDDMPLLCRYNLQGFYASVWDDSYLSSVLVALVEACDKRDFVPVVTCALQHEHKDSDTKNTSELIRHGSLGDATYRTLLYLAKYQCTTAFHTFFPATLKPCKGCTFKSRQYRQ